MDCANLAGCSFVKKYQDHPDFSWGIKGYIASYCKGSKESMCLRKITNKKLGSTSVPENMMPTGRPLPNTPINNWNDEVLSLLQDADIFLSKNV